MPEGSFGLALQQVATASEKALVATAVLSRRQGDSWFSEASLAGFFAALRVPPPGDLRRTMNRLRSQGLVIQGGSRGSLWWAPTPLGEDKARRLLVDMPTAGLDAELALRPGSDFGHVRHPVISPAFAPPKWLSGINRLLEAFPFESNVFLMTRFANGESDRAYLDPIAGAITTLRDVLHSHGLHLHLAADRQLDDDLLGNVTAHMWACQYGIGILEDRLHCGLNYNVVIEVGAMLMTGRRCALLKDRTAPNLPTDIAGQIYKPIDLEKLESIATTTHRWVAEDLGLGSCPSCPG